MRCTEFFKSTKYAFPGTEIYPHAKDFVSLGSKRAADRLKSYQDEIAELDRRIQAFNDMKEGKELTAGGTRQRNPAA